MTLVGFGISLKASVVSIITFVASLIENISIVRLAKNKPKARKFNDYRRFI